MKTSLLYLIIGDILFDKFTNRYDYDNISDTLSLKNIKQYKIEKNFNSDYYKLHSHKHERTKINTTK